MDPISEGRGMGGAWFECGQQSGSDLWSGHCQEGINYSSFLAVVPFQSFSKKMHSSITWPGLTVENPSPCFKSMSAMSKNQSPQQKSKVTQDPTVIRNQTGVRVIPNAWCTFRHSLSVHRWQVRGKMKISSVVVMSPSTSTAQYSIKNSRLAPKDEIKKNKKQKAKQNKQKTHFCFWYCCMSSQS